MAEHQTPDYAQRCPSTCHDPVTRETHSCYLPEGHNWTHVCGVCNVRWAEH